MNKLFKMSHKELQLLVVDLRNNKEIVSDSFSRFLLYEAYKRHFENLAPLNIKWIESSLKLSFPKVHALVEDLIKGGFFIKQRSPMDKRVIDLKVTNKLIQGINLFEKMKMNELNDLDFNAKRYEDLPSLSELNAMSVKKIKAEHLSIEKIKEEHLDEYFKK